MKERIIEFPGYLEPKPELSKWNYLWMLAILAGVAGLWFVAYTSMIRQGFEPFPAACLSSLIEIGTFGAGFNLVQGNKMTWFEIVVGLITSALYNYVHIRAINIQAVTKVADTDWLLLGIYGVGPLLITFSAALWVGREVHRHKQSLIDWRAGGKKFVADQEQKAVTIKQETNRKEEEDHLRREEAERQDRERQAQMQMQLDYQKEKLRAEEETKREVARLEEERKLKVAQARIEARERAKSESANPAQSAQFAQDERAKYENFAQAMQSNGTHEWTGEAIAQTFNVSRRTGNYWLARWKEEHPDKVISSN